MNTTNPSPSVEVIARVARAIYNAYCEGLQGGMTDDWDEHTDLALHLRVEHDFDMDAEVEKWPDGAWVIHDQTLTPDDFTEAPDA